MTASGPGRRPRSGAPSSNRIADLLERDAEEIAGTETRNTGKALREGRYDVADVVKVFRYYAGLADKDAGRLVATGSRDALSRIVYEPIGVCALIGPWNYPLLQVAWKVAPAIAAGDTFVVKPASRHAADGDPPDACPPGRRACRRASPTSSSDRATGSARPSPRVPTSTSSR